MNPPNIREVDCCANCVYSIVSFDHGEYYCGRFIDSDIEDNNICDDFKREE